MISKVTADAPKHQIDLFELLMILVAPLVSVQRVVGSFSVRAFEHSNHCKKYCDIAITSTPSPSYLKHHRRSGDYLTTQALAGFTMLLNYQHLSSRIRFSRVISSGPMQYWGDQTASSSPQERSNAPPIPKHSTEDALQGLRQALPPQSKSWLAFYSSVTGGIVSDPALMVLPVDDHLVHRGHAVFDTANIAHGKVYGLSFHLDRLLKSAKAARIDHAPSKEELRHAVLHTVAASGARDGAFVRYWLSAGRGDFLVSPSRCVPEANFYVMVHEGGSRDKALSQKNGVHEAFVPASVVPFKPKMLANAKTTNYLLNALTAMAAEDRGGALGIGVDDQGNITEQATACVAFLGADQVLRCPPFNPILEGTTLRRAVELLEPIPGVFNGTVEMNLPVTIEHAKNAVEVISFGGGAVLPIVSIDTSALSNSIDPGDSITVGKGVPGPLFGSIKEQTAKDFETSLDFLDVAPYSSYE
jgi:4-amino-4-deoxychorismate lyase